MNAAEYQHYLKTRHWKTTREKKLKLENYTCEYCKKRENLEVHHLTYIRLYRELMTDLAVLCDNCHHQIHHSKDFYDSFFELKNEKYNAENDTDFFDWG